jgi:hypothetical protein
MPTLLEHPAPLVRAHALELVRSRRLTDELPRVKSLMHDDDARFAFRQVMTYGALSGEEPAHVSRAVSRVLDLSCARRRSTPSSRARRPTAAARARDSRAVCSRPVTRRHGARSRGRSAAGRTKPAPRPDRSPVCATGYRRRRAAMRSAGRGQLRRPTFSTLIECARRSAQTEGSPAREGSDRLRRSRPVGTAGGLH